jgi:hypothetical protein
MRRLAWIRLWLVVVILGLVVSGVTAFPLEAELAAASGALHGGWMPFPAAWTGVAEWVDRVHEALVASYRDSPFLAYGTDWLAFAHLMIAVAFVGPMRDPVRNVWVIRWGLVMCVAIVPLALIAGAARGIPWGWQLLDISFGVVAAVPLTAALVLTRRLERTAADGAPVADTPRPRTHEASGAEAVERGRQASLRR